MDKSYAELLGIIIGDGHLDNAQKHYRIGFTGDPNTEVEYYEYIKSLIERCWNKDAKIAKRGRGLRIIINSKQIFLEVTGKYNIPIGQDKSHKVTIPEEISKDWELAKYTLKGIVDTDGSVFTSNKPGSPNYPSIEITTCSNNLAIQIKYLLEQKGFRVANIRCDNGKKRIKGVPCFRIPLHGYENLRKWNTEIGFSNHCKKRKAEMILNSKPGSQASLRHSLP